MGTKTEKLNRLFSKWIELEKQLKDSFAKDGIINEGEWDRDESNPQILFILKEPNDFKLNPEKKINEGKYKKYEGDLRKKFDAEHWPIIGCWSYGIKNAKKDFLPNLTEAEANCKKFCRMSAIVNLKKTSGQGKADIVNIRTYAGRFCDKIIQEIEIISPKIIICGGRETFEILRDVVYKDKILILDKDNRYFRLSELEGKPLINYFHPSRPLEKDVMYYYLIMLYQRYLRLKIR